MSVLRRISDLVAPRFSVVAVKDLQTRLFDSLDVPEAKRTLLKVHTHTVTMMESFYGFRRRVHITQPPGTTARGIPLFGHIRAWELGGPWPAGVKRCDEPRRQTAKLLVFEGGKSPNNAA